MAKGRPKITGIRINRDEHSLRQFLLASQEVSNRYVDQYIPIVYGVSPDVATWDMINGLARKYMENKKPTADVIQIHDQLMAAAESLSIIFDIKDRLNTIDKWKLSWRMVILGSDYKIMTNSLIPASDIELCEELQDRFARDRFRRAAMAQNAKKEALYHEAEDLARKKWSEGDQSYHNEMTDYIISLAHYNEQGLSRVTLLRRLKPIAREYDRVRGDRGAKKERV